MSTPPGRRRAPGAAALAALLLALAAPAARAQRAQCGFGLGLQALAGADRALAAPPGSLLAARDQAGTAAGLLRQGQERLAGCGCPRAAEQAAEALGLAEQAQSEASVPAARRTLERARFSLTLAREALGRTGCS